MNNTHKEFGAFKPTPSVQRIRQIAHKLPHNYIGRKLASFFLGPAGGRKDRPYDVPVFDSQRARLHPHDNICEKRVYLTPRHWDPVEREFLARTIANHGEVNFNFLDVGANAGLYTLFARAEAKKNNLSFRAICVEPSPLMLDRLKFNVAASNASREIQLMPYAAAASNGDLRFASNTTNRGMSQLDKDGDIIVEGRTLLDILTEANSPRVDAMKIDIEGHEFAALNAFFKASPEYLWPALAIVEIEHEKENSSASKLFLTRNYGIALSTRMNTIFVRAQS